MTEQTVTKGIRLQRAVYAVVLACTGWFFRLRCHYTYTPYTPQDDTFLLLGNHNAELDPFFTVIGLRRHMRFVASANLLRGFFGGIIRALAGPIPRKKGASADDTVRLVQASLANGISVAMYPEGNRSWDGETGFIPPRTARLVKEGAGSLITFRIDGGFLRAPRWAKHKRRGPIHGHVVREYARAELDAMTEQEIYDAICADLYANAFAEQRQTGARYRGRKLAEGMELPLFICPHCHGVATLRGKGDVLRCEKCGVEARCTDTGWFAPGAPFENLLLQSKWQKEWLRENAAQLALQTGAPLFTDRGLQLTRAGVACGDRLEAQFFGDRIEVVPSGGRAGERRVFPLAHITGMGAFSTTRVFFTCDGVYWQLHARRQISGVRYFALWRVLTGRAYI